MGASRRQFVRRAATGVLGAALAPGAVRAVLGGRPATGHSGRVPEGLPRRVVGLRTRGGDFRFDPVGLRIEPGETLVWLNMGDFHTATAFHPQYDDFLASDVPLRIPRNAEPFHSGMLGIDATEYEHTFPVEGVYDYFCQPHYSFGMVGRLVVGEARGGPAVSRPLSELNEAAREMLPPVEHVTGPLGRTFELAARLNGLLWRRANDRPVEPAPDAIRDLVAADDALRQLVDSAGVRGSFDAALEATLSAAPDAGYDRVVAEADRVKDLLETVRLRASA